MNDRFDDTHNNTSAAADASMLQMYREMGICGEVYALGQEVCEALREPFSRIDENAQYNQNSRVIALGEGYYVQGTASEIGEGLVFSGAVANDATALEVTSAQMNWFGNCSPVDITLGDITATDGLIFSAIVFLKDDGRVKTVDHAQLGTVKEKYTYWEAGDTEDGAGGWYFEDDENAEYNQNARVIAAGEGFYLQGTASEIGQSISIPSAL